MTRKGPTSFRLSEAARAKLLGLAELYGISQASVLEMIIRDRSSEEFRKICKDARKAMKEIRGG